MSNKKDRRDFLKIAAVGTAGIAMGPLLMKEAAAADTIRINPRAKAVLPSGQLADRRAILKQLGLNPNTPADSWLSIFSCGSNAAALTDRTREQLRKRGVKMDMPQNRMLRR